MHPFLSLGLWTTSEGEKNMDVENEIETIGRKLCRISSVKFGILWFWIKNDNVCQEVWFKDYLYQIKGVSQFWIVLKVLQET